MSNPHAMRINALRGVWRERKPAHSADRAYFCLTRLSEDGRYAYGWFCDILGERLPGSTLAKLDMNASRTAPKGFVR